MAIKLVSSYSSLKNDSFGSVAAQFGTPKFGRVPIPIDGDKIDLPGLKVL